MGTAGDYVASIGLDDDHSMAVYHWGQKRLVATGPTDKDKVFGLSFISTPTAAPTEGKGPAPKATAADRLVTCGHNHVKFWQINGRNLNCQKGVFGGKGPKQNMLSVASLDGMVITAGTTGSLFIWDGHKYVGTRMSCSDRPHTDCLCTG
jgi:echinoderm microtubule-associated protein-like 6